MAEPLGDIMAKGLLHLWVRGKRLPIFVAVVVEETHITSKNPFVHPVDTVQLLRCVHTVGQRRPTAPDSF